MATRANAMIRSERVTRNFGNFGHAFCHATRKRIRKLPITLDKCVYSAEVVAVGKMLATGRTGYKRLHQSTASVDLGRGSNLRLSRPMETASQIKIAVVDDDESVRESLLGLVESVGYDAATFRSAEEFLYLKRLDEFACLILDIRLPGMSGLELYCHMITKHERVPTVFITAHADRGVQSRALAKGAAAFLFKPFKPEALLDALRTAVAK